MILDGPWCVPESHDGIADELVHRAAVSRHGLCHGLEILPECGSERGRLPRLRKGREATDVRKEDRELFDASPELGFGTALEEHPHELDGHVLLKAP